MVREESVKSSRSNPNRPHLIIFDVEGVLIPKRRYLLFEASRRLSFSNFIRMLLAGILYEIGLLPLKSALQKIYRQLRGLPADDLYQLYKKVPLIPGVREVFQKLQQAKCKTALISSGLPQLFVEHLAKELGADLAVGLNLKVNNGQLTGEISGDVIETNGKALVLQRIVEKEGLTPEECALIIDDRNNLPMFRLCGLKIGYNPDFLVSVRSDLVARGDLGETLPFITGYSSTIDARSIPKRDLIREAIHASGFFVALVCAFLSFSRVFAAFLIFVVMTVYMISELARMQGFNVPVTSTITWNAAITPEIYEFVTSPIFFAVGIIIALTIFPLQVGYAAIAIFTLGDSSATLFGRRFGKHVFPYNKGKMVEGTFFGFLFAFAGALLFMDPLRALAGAAVGMFVETLPTPVNDNLTIPIISGLVLMAVL